MSPGANFFLLIVIPLWLAGAPGAVASATSGDGAVLSRTDPLVWRADLQQFRRDVLDRDAALSDSARREAWARLGELDRRLAALTDPEVAAELARIAALAGNAHTRVDPLRNRGVWRRFPIRIWKFPTGWRIIAVRPGHEALLGAVVVKIGGVSMDDAEAAVRPLFAGNDGWAAYMASYSLTSAEALSGSGWPDPNMLALELETSTGRQEVSLPAEPSERRTRTEENWWYLAAGHPQLHRWRHAAVQSPLVLQQPSLGYAYAECSQNIGYVRLNRTADQAGRPPMETWGTTLLERLERGPPARLIIDLRFNTGGDLSKALPLIAGLIDSAPGRQGALTVLVNGQTFSAGITQAAWLKQNSTARFVGEPVGDHLSFWAEGDNVVLAGSGLTARYSTGAHHYQAGDPPDRMRDRLFFRLEAPDLDPDVLVPWTWEDFAAGKDTALDSTAPGLACGSLN